MKTNFTKPILGGLVAALLLASGTAFAQQDRPDRPRRGGDRGDFRERFMERIMDRFQEYLGGSDTEWTVLEPRITKVMELQRQVERRGGGLGFLMRFGDDDDDRRGPPGRGRGGPGGRGPGGPDTGMPEQHALRTAIENNASADELQQALKAYRAAIKEQEQKLKEAREQLRQVVTVEQECKLVMVGFLN